MSDGGLCCAQTPTAVEKTSNSSDRGRMRFGCNNPHCGRCQSNRSRPLVFGITRRVDSVRSAVNYFRPTTANFHDPPLAALQPSHPSRPRNDDRISLCRHLEGRFRIAHLNRPAIRDLDLFHFVRVSLTKGIGADSVLECVGTQEAMEQAIQSTRPGGFVSYVGVPHSVQLDAQPLFFSHVHLHGGPAPTSILGSFSESGRVLQLRHSPSQRARCMEFLRTGRKNK